MKRKAVVSVLMRESVKETLKDYYDICELRKLNCLPKPTASHPDMQVLKLGDTVIRAKGAELSWCSAVESENELGCVYPCDVGLNAFLACNTLFAKKDSIDPAVRKICEEKGINIVNVNQGYAKCSTLVIGEKAVISADVGILKAAADHGLNTLHINPGGIRLDGYDYGFIGGASHFDEKLGLVFFYGDLSSHGDAARIVAFIKENGVKIICCDKEELTDYGGAVLI